MSTSPRRPSLRALLAVGTLAMTAAGAGTFAAADPRTPTTGSAAKTPFTLVSDRDVDDRLPQPEDRYAVAGGCYTVEAPGQGFVTETDGTLGVSPDASAAAPFHFQATRLGEYLIATNEGRDTRYEGAWWDVRNYLAAGSTAGLLESSRVTVAKAPSESAEWRLVASGANPEAKSAKGQTYLLSVPSRDAALAVKDGALTLAAEGTPLRLRHVADDNPNDEDRNGTACASWPEIETGATGEPKPTGKSPSAPVKGFFESHVHGMAFEFLGGELRCGRPWHEYGVEYALGSCDEEKNSPNRVLEVPLGGNSAEYAATYDPQGWPEFRSWPRNRTLTHEQFYWRWIERAHAGGLRLMTNLLVENTALCQHYPVKRNSCNEMDSIRLQAERMFELQDYVDAQNGGPGEGWLRIVSTPAEARKAVHAGRLAVMLGIETSALFDCEEKLDVPQCTKEQIDDRLQEVFDMGVRQVQLVNKFDNALSGVTGDPGTTGMVVNAGNKYVTGHFWDMRSCTPENDGHDHEHGEDIERPETAVDRLQLSPTDATPAGAEGVDALAGRILDQFGRVRSIVAPAYPAGPHCNARGLTELGAHALRGIVAKGMIFDPDHMSAKAQLDALNLLQNDIAPAERAAAKKAGRAAVKPSVMSSHSWSNDVVYQRIFDLDGVVAPYANEPTRYVKDWVDLRRFAATQASPGYQFGMGYGADTNGLGGQPPARKDPKRSLAYTSEGFAAPIGGVRLRQHTSGLRTFDITKEGVAMYGLFADWFQEVALAADELAPQQGGGRQILDDMLDGAETYLQLWERATYGANECVADQSTLQVEDLHAALGGNLEGFLDAVGQPADRTDDAYVYCAEDDSGALVPVEVAFDAAGRATGVSVSDADLAGTAVDTATGPAGAVSGTVAQVEETAASADTDVPADADAAAADAAPADVAPADVDAGRGRFAATAPQRGAAADGHEHGRDADDHAHGLAALPASASSLLAAGGGVAALALVVTGLAALASHLLTSRRRSEA